MSIDISTAWPVHARRYMPPESAGSEMPPREKPLVGHRTDRRTRPDRVQKAAQPVRVCQIGMTWYALPIPKGALFGFDYSPDRMPGVKSVLGSWYCLGETCTRPLYRSSVERVGTIVYVKIYRRPEEESERIVATWEPSYSSKTARRIMNYILGHDYEYTPEEYHAPNGMRMSRYSSPYACGGKPEPTVITSASVTAGCKVGPRWLSEEAYFTERMGMTSPNFNR